jgi:hypothetical protein
MLDSRKDTPEDSPADEEKNIDRGRYGDQSAGSDYSHNFDRDLDDEIPF